jgi:EcoEI R protein C-terminal
MEHMILALDATPSTFASSPPLRQTRNWKPCGPGQRQPEGGTQLASESGSAGKRSAFGNAVADPSKTAPASLALSTGLAQASRAQLTEIIRELAPEMKNKRRADNTFLAIDLPDFIASAQHVIVMPNGTQVHVEEYRKRIDQRILRIADEHPALRALRDGRSPTADELIDLERVLHNELESPDISFSGKTARAVYGLKWDNSVGFLGLLRHVLALDAILDYASVVGKAFDEHITSHNYTGDQIRFLRGVKDVFLSSRRLSESDLYDSEPLTAFGRNAVERLFSPAQVQELVHLTEELAV